MKLTLTLCVETFKALDLFDNILYRDMKHVIEDEDELEVDIEDMGFDEPKMECATRFSFTLSETCGEDNCSGDESGRADRVCVIPETKYVVDKFYSSSSNFAQIMVQLEEEERVRRGEGEFKEGTVIKGWECGKGWKGEMQWWCREA